MSVIVFGCHGPSYKWENDKTDELIAKSDSIVARAEKSGNILDSVTTKTVDETTDKINLLTKTIEIYKTKNTKMMIVENNIKTINRRDTVYIEVDKSLGGNSETKISVKSDSTTTYSTKRDSSLVVFWSKETKKITLKQMNQAKGLIASLSDDIKNYNTQIRSLIRENLELKKENSDIKDKIESLRKRIDSASLVISENKKIIEIGSTITASAFRVEGIGKNWMGEEVRRNKARNVEKLKIYFSLEENKIAETGNKNLYVCVSDPSGNALGNDTDRIVTREGKEKIFSRKFTIEYKKVEHQEIFFYLDSPDGFKPGVYFIDVYQNGFRIKFGSITLTKGLL
jgi:hypothetical protein